MESKDFISVAIQYYLITLNSKIAETGKKNHLSKIVKTI